jgi:hypothetical protein
VVVKKATVNPFEKKEDVEDESAKKPVIKKVGISPFG